MDSTWPIGVTTELGMHRYAQVLFGNCAIENLLEGLPFDVKPGCFLWRVKDACKQGEWSCWPGLIEEAMEATVAIHGIDAIQVKSRQEGRPRSRLYDTLQVTPNGCRCRASFGGDKHQRYQTSASETNATLKMHKMLMDKFKPKDEDWYQNKFSYYAKAYHLVLNRYNRNDGIDPHQDLAPTYDARNPIASLSFGRGSILTIQNTLKTQKPANSLVLPIP